jgi:hypothetical protein
MDREPRIEQRVVRRCCETDRTSHQAIPVAFRRLAASGSQSDDLNSSEQTPSQQSLLSQEAAA